MGGALLLDVEVEVGGEGEVLLLPAVEVHVPAQLGQQQQLARLSTANINTGIIHGVRHIFGHLDTLYLQSSEWSSEQNQERAVCHLSVWLGTDSNKSQTALLIRM